MMQMHYFYEMTGCCSIHRDAEKGPSPKPRFIRPHTCTVPGRMVAGRLFIKLPRRVLLGNWASAKWGSRKLNSRVSSGGLGRSSP